MIFVGFLCLLWLIFGIWFLFCKGNDNNIVRDKTLKRVRDVENRYPKAYKQFLINFDDNSESFNSFLTKVASRSDTTWEQEEKEIEEQCNLFDKYIKHLAEKRLEAGGDRNGKIKIEEQQKKRTEELHKKRMMLEGAESKDWPTQKGVHHYFFFYYYPKRFTSVTEFDRDVRNLIWNFKDGIGHDKISQILITKLQRVYGEALDLLTFVCIPASTREVNHKRYCSFMADVCNATGMANGYEHITIVKEKEPTHLGGESPAEYSYDTDFFNGRQIILFDDVVTRGRSLSKMKIELENVGAHIVAALSIGRTYSDFYGDNREPHPWVLENAKDSK